MLKLASNQLFSLGQSIGRPSGVWRISEKFEFSGQSPKDFLLVRESGSFCPSGFAGYLFFERPSGHMPVNAFLLEKDLSYLTTGDVVRIEAERNAIRVLYRRNSPHNFLLMTEQCNNFCLMCSQPPKQIDDSYLSDELLDVIQLISPETKTLGITGGEPTLLGERFFNILKAIQQNLPTTAVHILSNGRRFKDYLFAEEFAAVPLRDVMVGIPLYSDNSSIHDHVVQADGAFDDTIRGILNLKALRARVEIRVVVHKLTYERLPELAYFIRRNLTFCDQIVFMGLEMTGFTKINLEKLWIDPKDYQPELREAVRILAAAKMHVSVYNHQLCVLHPSILPFNRKSISDWKNEFMPECAPCKRKNDCGGFFSSAKIRYSAHIRPFLESGLSAAG